MDHIYALRREQDGISTFWAFHNREDALKYRVGLIEGYRILKYPAVGSGLDPAYVEQCRKELNNCIKAAESGDEEHDIIEWGDCVWEIFREEVK